MNVLRLTLFCTIALAGCTAASPDLEPLPGSLTYGEKAASRRTQADPGTMIQNRFLHQGTMVYETYEVQPDHSYKLVRRSIADTWPPG
ncbi:hypothetical protein PYH37_003647 [Sinorhizobium numidicum]|uniref:Transmembrane protein n=1 Tax=Sinorhizobium numidicum TaxID=680248 RepID=A0ABY8CU11_9HYPH|nr:hypothetical protein [Sinorhizobium numidicum]WEX78728.1 hypothetical protein PYH37_003647 [Sinorhizobium numidicum]WEX82125.1 hypothetical protein PYH38_004360 [Sinorhizobium numidicum]